MEPKSLLPRSQQPAICPYHERDQSRPHSISSRSTLILSPFLLRLSTQVLSFYRAVLLKHCVYISSPLRVALFTTTMTVFVRCNFKCLALCNLPYRSTSAGFYCYLYRLQHSDAVSNQPALSHTQYFSRHY
jgi:hypothetical protein